MGAVRGCDSSGAVRSQVMFFYGRYFIIARSPLKYIAVTFTEPKAKLHNLTEFYTVIFGLN